MRKSTIITHLTLLDENREIRGDISRFRDNTSPVLQTPHLERKEITLEYNPFFHDSHYGTKAFEGIRAMWDQKRRQLHIINLEEHITRLFNSAKALYMIKPEQQAESKIPTEITAVLKEYDSQNDIFFTKNEQYVKEMIIHNLLVNIDAGLINPESGEIYIRPLLRRTSHKDDKLGVHSTTHHITLEIMAQQWPAYLSDPVLAVYPEKISNPLRKHKSGANYGYGGIAKNWAMVGLAAQIGKKFDDALLQDMDGNITEATGANFFAWEENNLTTAPEGEYLMGTKRANTIELAKGLGITVVLNKYATQNAIEQLQSAFLTGTATGIEPIKAVYDPVSNLFKVYTTNEATKLLQTEYRNMVSGEAVNENNKALQQRIVFNNTINLTAIPRYR